MKNPSGGQEQLVQEILGNMKNGFFVEVGGTDSGRTTNSLWLEMHFGWKGLLLEPNPVNYAVLKQKNRKVWTSNTCLSIYPYPHQKEFMQDKSDSAVDKIAMSDEGITENVITVQCIPLFSLLSALNVTEVDYFSLGVEGLELEILQTVPFSDLSIKILSMEFIDSKDEKRQKNLLEFMESKGYKMVRKIRKPLGMANDFMFVHSPINYVA